MVNSILAYMASASIMLLSAPSIAEVPQPTADDLIAKIAQPDGPVMIVAHRGCWYDGFPENSLAGIEHCIAQRMDMVEIDVAITADGIPVLLHDRTLDRTTNGAGPIAEITFDELGKLRLRKGAGGAEAEITDQSVPTLAEALAIAKGRILVNLDVKGEDLGPAFEVVREQGVSQQIIMKRDWTPSDPRLRTSGFLGETMYMPIVRQCIAGEDIANCTNDLPTYAAKYGYLDPVAVEITYREPGFLRAGSGAIRSSGSRVWVNTLSPNHAAGAVDRDAVEDPERIWGCLVWQGANIIQTDRPAELRDFLERIGDATQIDCDGATEE